MPASESPKRRSELPRVTIVTPTYNQGQYLAETIDSVLAQDYPNIEYIVIDDGSTDNTRDVLRRYDGRIQWESQENQGQAATLNRGWAMASGEIIAYLSSDDLLKPNAVAESVHYMLDHPEAVLVYPDFELIDSVGRHIRDFRTPDYCSYDLRVNLICQPGPGVLFWKKYFDLIGGWNPDLKQIPDYEYWLRLSLEGDFKRNPSVLSASRVHEGSQSFNVLSIDQAMEPVRVIKGYYESSIGKGLEPYYNRALGKAHLLAARMLFRSDRIVIGLKQVWRASLAAPNMLYTLVFWRVLLSGIVGKGLYRLLFSTSQSSRNIC